MSETNQDGDSAENTAVANTAASCCPFVVQQINEKCCGLVDEDERLPWPVPVDNAHMPSASVVSKRVSDLWLHSSLHRLLGNDHDQLAQDSDQNCELVLSTCLLLSGSVSAAAQPRQAARVCAPSGSCRSQSALCRRGSLFESARTQPFGEMHELTRFP